MPNRILRDYTDSLRFDGIGAETERLFIRLLTKADDYGRFHADPRLVGAACFPLEQSIEPKQIIKWLDELQQRGLILRYEAQGKHCLAVINYGQRLRNSRVKFPPPADKDSEWLPTSGDSPQLAATSRDFPPESESQTETETESQKGKQRAAEAAPPLPVLLDTEEFRTVWKDYGDYRKQAKLRRLTPISVRNQWAEMEEWGHDEAVEAVRTTIRKGWQGIFKPKHNGTNHNGGSTHASNSTNGRERVRRYHGVGDPSRY
jgi:hypothetical protein